MKKLFDIYNEEHRKAAEKSKKKFCFHKKTINVGDTEHIVVRCIKCIINGNSFG